MATWSNYSGYNANPYDNIADGFTATKTTSTGSKTVTYNPYAGELNGITSPTAPAPAAAPAPAPTPAAAGPDPAAAYYDWLRQQQQSLWDTQAREQRQAASAFLTDVLNRFNLGSLAGSVDSLIQQWGTNTDVISLKLKETAPYRERFKGMLALQQKGITDITNEAQYLQLESQYRQTFREAGLGSFLGEAGTQAEYDKIAEIVGKFSLSVNEVGERISDAQRVAADTPQEVKDALRDYFGIDAGMLVEYSLDPATTAEKFNRIANTAIAGGLARQSGLQVGAGVADQMANLAGTGDINQATLGASIVDALGVRDSTARLAQIEGSMLTDDESVQASMQLDANAGKKVKGLQSRERARFSGSSGFQTGSLSGGQI